MISDIFISLFVATLPVALLTWLLMGWALKSGRLQPFENKKEFEKNLKEMSEKAKKRKAAEKEARKEGGLRIEKPGLDADSRSEFFHGKWMMFGGNFYGTMAFYTLIYIEILEIFDFLGKLAIPENIGIGPLIQLLIGFIINSFKNLIAAFLWFTYWPDVLPAVNGWILLGAAWFGFMLGGKLARQYESRLHEPEALIQGTRKMAEEKLAAFRKKMPDDKSR